MGGVMEELIFRGMWKRAHKSPFLSVDVEREPGVLLATCDVDCHSAPR